MKKCMILHCISIYHLNFLINISLAGNLSYEALGNFCIAVMIVKKLLNDYKIFYFDTSKMKKNS